MKKSKSRAAAVFLLFFASGMAVGAPHKQMPQYNSSRPSHHHEDLFDEEELFLGIKGGPELTGYTPIQRAEGVESSQSQFRFAGGFAAEFIYRLLRVETDFFWNARAAVNSSDAFYSLSFPILIKIPYEVDRGFEFELGGGFEPDAVLFGADPHRSWMYGVLGSVGLLSGLGDAWFSLELRYNFGLNGVAEGIVGGRHRDFQVIAGVLWRL